MRFKEWLKLREAADNVTAVAQKFFTPDRQFDQRKRARKFLKWLTGLGIDVNNYIDGVEDGKPVEVPVPFSGGQVGAAFPVGEYVVKFTTDEREAKYASRLVGKEDEIVAKIHDVVMIPGDFFPLVSVKKKLFAIVQEKLTTGAPKRTRVAADVTYEYLDKFAQPLDDIEAAYNYILKNLLPQKKKWANDPGVHSQIRALLQRVKEMQDKYGFTYRDVHGGNVLMRKGKPTFFDLGRSTPVVGANFPDPRELG